MSIYGGYYNPYLGAKELVESGVIKLRWHDRMQRPPPIIPPEVNLADRIEGMLLGLAIGDSLGNTSESMLPDTRLQRHGRIEMYLPNRHADDQRVGLPSDDTQMAFWTLEHLLAEGRIDMRPLGIALSRRKIFGLGQSVREFLRNFKSGSDWTLAGAPSAGNGALMRIAPVLLPYLKDREATLWSAALMAGHLTHRDALSNVACVAFVQMLFDLLARRTIPESTWWVDTFLQACVDIEPDTTYQSRANHPPGFDGTLSGMIRDYVMPAVGKDITVTAACDIWHSGAYLLETVPSVIYILARYGHDPREAILAAVNETKDNDTIAAIVGAAVGALHGQSAFPRTWVDGLLGRTDSSDDGRVFELIARAGNTFGYGVSKEVLARVPEGHLDRPLLQPTVSSEQFIRGQKIEVKSPTYWVKVFGMLHQSWAAIDNLPHGGVRIWFFDDLGGVFDLLDYPTRQEARTALRLNQWNVAVGHLYGSLGRPGPDFNWSDRNGRPYSTRQYWVG